jgi:hypothetical protein
MPTYDTWTTVPSSCLLSYWGSTSCSKTSAVGPVSKRSSVDLRSLKLLSGITFVSVVCILWHSIRPSVVSYSIKINSFCCLCYERSIVPSTAIYSHLHRTLKKKKKIVFSRLCTKEEKVLKTAYM